MLGKSKARPRLWFPLGGDWRQQAVRAKGEYRPLKRLIVGSRANADRRVLQACIILPDTRCMWMTDNPLELKGVIDKLQEIHDQMTGKGQSKIVSLVESKSDKE